MNALQSFEADYRETYGLVRHALGLFPALDTHADDLVQDVYLSYWQHRDAIPPEKRKAWLVVTARRKAIDRLRRLRTQPQGDSSGLKGIGWNRLLERV